MNDIKLNNIVLIGFASSGKTFEAKKMSAEKGMAHIDLDVVIEEMYRLLFEEKLSVREIFVEMGADDFKTLETAALIKLICEGTENAVISTGGGTAINPENHDLLKSLGKIIYLTCDIDVIIERMKKAKGFPVSMGGSEAGVREVFAKREPIYREIADEVLT